MNWNWELLTQVFSDLVLAAFLAYIAYQQLRVGRREAQVDRLRLKHELYQRRLEVYDSTIEFLRKVIQEPANIGLQDLNTFHQHTYQSAFLFGDEILQYMDEVHLKALTLRKNHMELERLKSAPTEVALHLQWFADQFTHARGKFAPYMKMDDET